MKKFLAGAAIVGMLMTGMFTATPVPRAEAMWCPGAVNGGSVYVPIIFGVLVVEYCDWAPPVMGVDSHFHCEYGGFIGYGSRCDWRNNFNQIVPPPPGFV